MNGLRRRAWVFALVVVASVAAVAGYAMREVARVHDPVPGGASAVLSEATAPAVPIMFRSTAPGAGFGRVTAAGPMSDPPASADRPACERVHFAAGRGICLQAERGAITRYRAQAFDAHFVLGHGWPLAGAPSRARVSPDGRLAAFTVFVTGHAYTSLGFTTRSTIVDLRSGEVVVDDLEKLAVQRDGRPFKAADFNFWGVSFAPDGRRFYATLASGGKTLLVEGDIAARRMRVVHEDVECPSLSPDGRRVAFKRREPTDRLGHIAWRLHVLDLASGQETALRGETRSVDDQVEWLDDRQIAYALPRNDQPASAATDLWALAIDRASAPRLLLPLAFSPAVLR
jgi:hypothetical protein